MGVLDYPLAKVCRERDGFKAAWEAERAARAREEARALALEAKLARVREDAVTVREAYEQAHLALQEQIIALRTRCGGEMLRADAAERVGRFWLDSWKGACEFGRGWRSRCAESEAVEKIVHAECDTLRAEVARLRAVVAQLQAVPLSEEGDDDAALGR